MHNGISAHVVSARPFGAGGIVYFDGAGEWTADLRRAQVARSPVGRKAMLRVAAALASGNSIHDPKLVEIQLDRPGHAA